MLARISSQLPEQKEGLFFEVVVVHVVVVVTVVIVVTVVVVVIIVGPRKLTLKYGQNQVK